MRCDDIFEILTSGPFPAGATSDDAVEQHLESCHECRRFAEALQPIAELRSDSGLPRYQGRLGDATNAGEAIDLVDRVQTIVFRENTIRRNENLAIRQSTKKSHLQFAVVVCAASLIGAAVTFGGPILAKEFADARIEGMNSDPTPIQVAFAGKSCNGEALPHLKTDSIVPIRIRNSKDACCLTCHVGGPSDESRGESRRATIGLVVLSCQKCHEEKSQWMRL